MEENQSLNSMVKKLEGAIKMEQENAAKIEELHLSGRMQSQSKKLPADEDPQKEQVASDLVKSLTASMLEQKSVLEKEQNRVKELEEALLRANATAKAGGSPSSGGQVSAPSDREAALTLEVERLRKLLESAKLATSPWPNTAVPGPDNGANKIGGENTALALRIHEVEALAAERQKAISDLEHRLSMKEDNEKKVMLELTLLRAESQASESYRKKLDEALGQIEQSETKLLEELARKTELQNELLQTQEQVAQLASNNGPNNDVLSKIVESRRQITKLQGELSDELSKRQAVFDKNIEKDRAILELQMKMHECQGQLLAKEKELFEQKGRTLQLEQEIKLLQKEASLHSSRRHLLEEVVPTAPLMVTGRQLSDNPELAKVPWEANTCLGAQQEVDGGELQPGPVVLMPILENEFPPQQSPRSSRSVPDIRQRQGQAKGATIGGGPVSRLSSGGQQQQQQSIYMPQGHAGPPLQEQRLFAAYSTSPAPGMRSLSSSMPNRGSVPAWLGGGAAPAGLATVSSGVPAAAPQGQLAAGGSAASVTTATADQSRWYWFSNGQAQTMPSEGVQKRLWMGSRTFA